MKDAARAMDPPMNRLPVGALAPYRTPPARIDNSKTALRHPSNLAPPARPDHQIQ